MIFFLGTILLMIYFRVTILRDKHTRQSKGVAFVLFLDRDGAYAAVRALNKTQVVWLDTL